MIGEFIGRVPDLPPLREQFKLACGPAYVMIIWFVFMRTFFWYFWLTIQNTANRQVRNLFLEVS